MTEERTEEHRHVITETEEGTSESHSHKIVERDSDDEPEVTTIVKETTIVENED